MLNFLFDAVLSKSGIFLKCKTCHSLKRMKSRTGDSNSKIFKFIYQVHHYVRPFTRKFLFFPDIQKKAFDSPDIQVNLSFSHFFNLIIKAHNLVQSTLNC
jgi:hypothetical protein